MFSLLSKRLIRISGSDAANFLQGITTNDIISNEHGSKAVQYTAFLNYKGRILFDSMIYHFPSYFLLECINPIEFVNFLNKYKLRRSVKIEDETSLNVLWCQNYVENAFEDPRTPSIGFRLLSKDSAVQNSQYQSKLYELGIAEGNDIEAGVALPFQYNLDFLNCLNFGKGCYIGQEHVSRIRNQGVIRRRILPIQGIEKEPHRGSDVFVKDTHEKVGKVINYLGSIGIALLKLEVDGDIYSKTLTTENDSVFTAFKPSWWPKD